MGEIQNFIDKVLDGLLILDLLTLTVFIKPISHLFMFVRYSNITAKGKNVFSKQLACAKNKGMYVKGQ